ALAEDAMEGGGEDWPEAYRHCPMDHEVHDMVDPAISSGALLPGAAAKLYGTCNFLEQGMYGRVGAGGLRAIREHADEGGREVTPPIPACLDLIKAVPSVRPERGLDSLPCPLPRFVATSDAVEDVLSQGSGGFHSVWLHPRERESVVAVIGPEVYSCFTPGDQKCPARAGNGAVRSYCRDCFPCFWYVENVAALMVFIRGRPSSLALKRMAQLIHLALFALRASFFFEYIPSKTNWADA
ncbi:FCPB, partial [Symbiodinium necroappetens]